MYCNKCGKEITGNVSFCTHCGEKINIVQHETKKDYVSVCTKCGQTVEGNMKYCTHCGGEIEKREANTVAEKNHVSASSVTPVLNNAAKNFVGLIGVALMGILALVYLVTAIKGFEGNLDAFDWTSDTFKTLGIVFHWGICAISVAECVNCVVRVMTSGVKGKHLIQTSISMLVTTILIWIGTMIWNDFGSDDLSIIMYRVVGTYEQLISTSFVLLVIALICGVMCSKAEAE